MHFRIEKLNGILWGIFLTVGIHASHTSMPHCTFTISSNIGAGAQPTISFSGWHAPLVALASACGAKRCLELHAGVGREALQLRIAQLHQALAELPKFYYAGDFSWQAQQKFSKQGLSCSELRALVATLTRDIKRVSDVSQATIATREALLRQVHLEGVDFVDQEKLQQFPLEWQYQYLQNEYTHHQTFSGFESKKQDLMGAQALLQNYTKEFEAAAAHVHDHSIDIQSHPVFEQEASNLHRAIPATEKLIARTQSEIAGYEKELAQVQKDRDAIRFPWTLSGEAKKNLAKLEVKEKRLVQNIDERKNDLKNYQQLIVSARDELRQLESVILYEEQCTKQYKLENLFIKGMYEGTGCSDADKEIVTAVCADLAQPGQVCREISEVVSADGRALCQQCGISEEVFGTFKGSALQQCLFRQVCGAVDHAGQIVKEYHDNERVYSYAYVTVQSCGVAAEMIRKGTPTQALAMTKLACGFARVMDVVVGAARGFVSGSVGSYTSLLHTVLHPLQCLQEFGQVGALCLNVVSGDQKAWQCLMDASKAFVQLPLDQQVGHAVELLTTFIMPGPGKLGKIAGLDRFAQGLCVVVKKEGAALQALRVVDKARATIINGVVVPAHLVPTINELIRGGKVLTDGDITRWIEHLEAPAFSSWKHAVEGITEQISQAENKAVTVVENSQVIVQSEQIIPASAAAAVGHAQEITVKEHLVQDIATTVAEGTLKPVEANVQSINQSCMAVLKDGYYEVNGFKFSEYYYKKLWGIGGRPAPSLVTKEVLETAKIIVADEKQGFFRYVNDNWELVYNPITKEVWHLQPLK